MLGEGACVMLTKTSIVWGLVINYEKNDCSEAVIEG